MHGLTPLELLCYPERCKEPVPGVAHKAHGVPAPKARSGDGLNNMLVTWLGGCLHPCPPRHGGANVGTWNRAGSHKLSVFTQPRLARNVL